MNFFVSGHSSLRLVLDADIVCLSLRVLETLYSMAIKKKSPVRCRLRYLTGLKSLVHSDCIHRTPVNRLLAQPLPFGSLGLKLHKTVAAVIVSTEEIRGRIPARITVNTTPIHKKPARYIIRKCLLRICHKEPFVRCFFCSFSGKGKICQSLKTGKLCIGAQERTWSRIISC